MARTVKPPFLSGLLDQLAQLRVQQALVMLCALGLYANTLGHQFVLDDGLVLSDNAIVQQGIRGIPDILAKDSFYGSIGESAYLTGHRYRPLPLITYALEVSLFGLNPFVHHAVNMLLYALTGLILLRFLRGHVFPTYPLAALATTLLFIFHPLHTEVVANIKSRDELLSLLFLLLTLHYLLAHVRPQGSTKDASSRTGGKDASLGHTPTGKASLLKAGLCFALALLSKENGVVFVLIVPLTLYILGRSSISRSLRGAAPFVAIAAGYVLLRFLLLGAQSREVTEVMDNPYLFASMAQKFATILFVFVKYLGLLFFPHPLTYDYSFRQIPYRTFGEPVVWGGALMLLGLLAYAIRGTLKRDLLAWCAFFFLVTWVLVSGTFFNIGAPMAERFMYQASVPFTIALVECMRRAMEALPTHANRIRPVFFASGIVLLSAGGYATITRNRVWRSGDELLLHDVTTSANSARANTYAGVACIHLSDAANEPAAKRAYALQAIAYIRRSEAIKPMYVPNYLNLGVAYMRLDDLTRAEAAWDTARVLDPQSGLLKQYDGYLFDLYYRRGLKAGADRDNAGAIIDLRKALKYGPGKADAWYNLGGAYYTIGDTAQARNCWERTLQLDPRNAGAQQGLGALKR
jgi:tetratricopeptide (TPR) repeat protein